MPVQAIGYCVQFVKLVFERECCRLPVIANQRAGFSGNPPVRGKMYRQLPYRTGNIAIFGGNCYPIPFNGGIATEVLRTGSQ